MPRGRGGLRPGAPGANYPNRSDLQTGPRTQPITTVPNQPYGAAKQQADAQRQMPLPQVLAGTLTPLDAPTQRPNEPITAGLPTGPGPGPEALAPMPMQQDTLTRGVGLLNSLGDNVSDDVKMLRSIAGTVVANRNSP